ncbi:MAG: SRPBCC family protein [Nocardioides sp.]
MNITGTSTLTADRATVWRALNDPAVLVASIPGCRRLEALGGDAYAMTVAAGVGSIKGVYDGQVMLSDHAEPSSFRMKAQGAGAAGTVGAEVMVLLADSATGGTELTYNAEAVVGGMIGGVGQRMLTGVSKKMAAEFFANVDAVLTGAAAGHPGTAVSGDPSAVASLPPGPATLGTAAPVRPAPGTVFTAPTPGGSVKTSGPGFVVGVAVGAAAALAGALVGAWISRRTSDIG